MNMEYYHNYKIVKVRDENGNEREIEYTDNIKDILTCENVIEQAGVGLSEIQKWLNNHEPEITNNLFFKTMPIYMPIVVGGITYAVSPLVVGDNNDLKSIFVVSSVFGMTVISGMYSIINSFGNKVGNIVSTKEYSGKKAELYAMMEIFKDSIERLEKLCNNKKTSVGDSYKSNDIVLEKLNPDFTQEWLEYYEYLFNSIGYNERKYIKYYNKGILDSKLSKKYVEDDVELAKKYIENRAKVLKKEKKF